MYKTTYLHTYRRVQKPIFDPYIFVNMKRIILAISAVILLFCGCTPNAPNVDSSNIQKASYRQISQEEASSVMASETGYIILDVRTQEEYDSGHIDGAICIPNETITGEDIPKLPDKNQLILVYCRSGRRSKEASQKLADMGYTNVLEFGGIIDWKG